MSSSTVCLIASICVLFSTFYTAEGYGLNQKTLVVSFDGFRQIYFDSRFLPWFSTFRQGGVYASNAQSVFPSETFPNHWSVVTGLYTESHGITGNNMYDPNLDATFTMSNLELAWWGQAEPIWVTARKQGKKTAASFWPGSAVVFPGNYTPDYYRPNYDSSVPLQTRIDEVVDYLTTKEVDLAFLYYNQPDNDGHHEGTDSEQLNEQLQLVDWYLSYLMTRLDSVGLGQDKLNVIICADHGMTTIKERLNLEDYVNTTVNVEMIPSYGAVMNLQPKAGKLDYVYSALMNGSIATGKFNVYKKDTMPTDFHYSNNARIMDIVIVCNIGYFMAPKKSTGGNAATHGYNPAERHMQPAFLARGPAFKTGGYKASKSFKTKDIYAIIAYVAGVDPLSTNATFADVANIFA